MFAALAALLDVAAPGGIETAIAALAGVFVRVGAVVALLPGFGEQTLPLRLRLAATVALTAIVWPVVLPTVIAAPEAQTAGAFGLAGALGAEAVVGLMLGIAIRLFVMALQLAGSIAAQATSVAQIFGAGVTPDPMPAIGNILTLAGVALALAAGLHVKAAAALSESYAIAPFGRWPFAGDVASWGVAHAASAFALAFSLAAPYVVVSFVYNLALGAVNKAMPQLMVAFVGAPAITGIALLILFLSAPATLMRWSGELDGLLAAPFATP